MLRPEPVSVLIRENLLLVLKYVALTPALEELILLIISFTFVSALSPLIVTPLIVKFSSALLNSSFACSSVRPVVSTSLSSPRRSRLSQRLFSRLTLFEFIFSIPIWRMTEVLFEEMVRVLPSLVASSN